MIDPTLAERARRLLRSLTRYPYYGFTPEDEAKVIEALKKERGEMEHTPEDVERARLEEIAHQIARQWCQKPDDYYEAQAAIFAALAAERARGREEREAEIAKLQTELKEWEDSYTPEDVERAREIEAVDRAVCLAQHHVEYWRDHPKSSAFVGASAHLEAIQSALEKLKRYDAALAAAKHAGRLKGLEEAAQKAIDETKDGGLAWLGRVIAAAIRALKGGEK